MLSSIVVVAALAGCAVPGPDVAPGEVFDPFEARNRKNHELNRAIDKAFIGPAGKGYAKTIPEPVQMTVGNFSDNLSLPGTVVNNLLQGNIKGAWVNTFRFAYNTVFGIGGLGDPASEVGIYEVETDFGETLHVWGAREGAYVELPLLGPSTERDAVGRVVDLFTNPLSHVLPSPEKYVGTAAGVLSKVGDRGKYADTVDSILYESADSYAQSRIIYLQNRRFELGTEGDSSYVDPYDDPYGDPYAE